MHRIKCQLCNATLKIKTIPEDKESLKLKCPKCKGVFSIDLGPLREEISAKEKDSKEVEIPKTVPVDYLDEILSKTKKKEPEPPPPPPPPDDKPKAGKQDHDRDREDDMKDIFTHERQEDIYYVKKANGHTIGPVNYSTLIQMARDGKLIGIDSIETKSGILKSPSSFIEIKRILQEKLLEKNLLEGGSLGIDHSYAVRKERNLVTFYLLLTLLIIAIIIFSIVEIPRYFKEKAREPLPDTLNHIVKEIDESELSGSETADPETVEDEDQVLEIINFSENSIIEYFNISGSQYRTAANHVRARNYTNALREIDNILLRYDLTPTPIILKLQIYLLAGNLDRALDDFSIMHSIKEDDIYINLGYGAIYTMLGNLNEARTYIERSRFASPDNPFTRYYSAVYEYRAKNYQRALEHVEDAIRYAPANFPFLRDMRNLQNKIKQMQDK